MASKDASDFWRALKTWKHNVCPVELAAQLEAFRALMGASLLRQSCQVLERVGIHGPIKPLYAHDSAAVRNSEGFSEIFDSTMGVKQGCPPSATLFG
ncbi:TPA: hypothetical protein ACH3X3_014546 [Trebouxia sp. C0006]